MPRTKKPASQAAAEEFRKELLERDETAAGEMAKRWLKVERSLQPNIEALVAEIQLAKEAGEEVNRVSLLQLRRYRDLAGQAVAELTRFNEYAGGVIDGLTLNAVGMAELTAADLILSTASDAGAVGITFNRLGVEAAQNLAALARAGQPLQKLLSLTHPIAVGGITDRLLKGVAVGINPRKIARGIIDDGLTQGFKHVMLVSRDQHMRAYRTATLQNYNDSGVVRAYRRLAAKNDRTCLACLALDGTVYELNVLMPAHPQDRCTMIPVLDRFPPVNYQTGEQWFKKQPEEYQRKAMGPGRFKLWQEGGFTFKQLATVRANPTWGPSAVVTPLKDLLKGGGSGTFQPPLPLAPVTPSAPPKVPKFKTRRQAEKWIEKNYPHVTADFKDCKPDALQPTIEALDDMAKRFPEVAAKLEYIGSYRTADKRPYPYDRHKTARGIFGGEFAHASIDGKRIGLNPKFYQHPERFKEALRQSMDAGWLGSAAPGKEIEYVIYHEWGHQVQNWLKSEDVLNSYAYGNIIGIDGREVVGTSYEQWLRNTIDHADQVSRYATTTTHKLDSPETWAEAFAMAYAGQESKKGRYVKGLEGWLGLLTERPLVPSSEWQWIDQADLSKAEREEWLRSHEELEAMFKEWGAFEPEQ